MAKDNVSKYVILGLLSIKPMSGYDMKVWIDNGISYFWCISYGQIYPALKDFVKEGMATFTTDQEEGRPEKKVYSLTDKGRSTLEEWLREPMDRSSSSYTATLTIKVYFGSCVPKEITINHLQEAISYKEATLEALQEIEAKNIPFKEMAKELKNKGYFYRMCTLNEGVIMLKAQIQWCNETIQTLKEDIW